MTKNVLERVVWRISSSLLILWATEQQHTTADWNRPSIRPRRKAKTPLPPSRFHTGKKGRELVLVEDENSYQFSTLHHIATNSPPKEIPTRVYPRKNSVKGSKRSTFAFIFAKSHSFRIRNFSFFLFFWSDKSLGKERACISAWWPIKNVWSVSLSLFPAAVRIWREKEKTNIWEPNCRREKKRRGRSLYCTWKGGVFKSTKCMLSSGAYVVFPKNRIFKKVTRSTRFFFGNYLLNLSPPRESFLPRNREEGGGRRRMVLSFFLSVVFALFAAPGCFQLFLLPSPRFAAWDHAKKKKIKINLPKIN